MLESEVERQYNKVLADRKHLNILILSLKLILIYF
jgi:hypothetical protein